MNKLFKKIIPYWDSLSFGDKCSELAMLTLLCALNVTFVVLVGGLATVITLGCFEEPVQAPVAQQSKAEQFANDLVTELAKKDLSVKIVVIRD